MGVYLDEGGLRELRTSAPFIVAQTGNQSTVDEEGGRDRWMELMEKG